MRRTMLLSLLVFSVGELAATPAIAQRTARACTFEALSPEEKSRYQSRYRRRLEGDGKAVADAWLREQVCMTPEQRKKARQKPLLDKKGRPCTKTRLEMRVTPGFDGAMTMSPVPVCAN